VCHLPITNLTSICERIEAFAQTVNKHLHLAFNGNGSEIKKGFNDDYYILCILIVVCICYSGYPPGNS